MTRQIDLQAWEYLKSLALIEEPREVIPETDGAELWRVADEHFLIIECIEHDDHRGGDMLLRVLPATWENFASVVNPEAGFEIHHYGPPEDRPIPDPPAQTLVRA